jgi:hypothetical protein
MKQTAVMNVEGKLTFLFFSSSSFVSSIFIISACSVFKTTKKQGVTTINMQTLETRVHTTATTP